MYIGKVFISSGPSDHVGMATLGGTVLARPELQYALWRFRSWFRRQANRLDPGLAIQLSVTLNELRKVFNVLICCRDK